MHHCVEGQFITGKVSVHHLENNDSENQSCMIVLMWYKQMPITHEFFKDFLTPLEWMEKMLSIYCQAFPSLILVTEEYFMLYI